MGPSGSTTHFRPSQKKLDTKKKPLAGLGRGEGVSALLSSCKRLCPDYVARSRETALPTRIGLVRPPGALPLCLLQEKQTNGRPQRRTQGQGGQKRPNSHINQDTARAWPSPVRLNPYDNVCHKPGPFSRKSLLRLLRQWRNLPGASPLEAPAAGRWFQISNQVFRLAYSGSARSRNVFDHN